MLLTLILRARELIYRTIDIPLCTPKDMSRLLSLPTIVVWCMAIFSSDVRAQASYNGQWIAGWFQAVLFYIPTVLGIVGQAF